MRRGLHLFGSLAIAALLAGGTILVLAPKAWAVCGGSIADGEVGATNPNVSAGLPAFGAKAMIWVNNFDAAQHQT